MIGSQISHYKISAKLGEGGMGVVYLALDTELQRKVALKVLPEELAVNSDRLARFRREAKTVAQLNHPNIVTLYSIDKAVPEGAQEAIVFLTMEFIEGRKLGSLVPRRGLELRRFFDLAIPLADAVSAAHQGGVTHRDLKPDNVMVTKDGRLKVLDFGLAKRTDPPPGSTGASAVATATYTAENKVLGTVAYMSPEQAEGKPLDHRSDIFSLGVVLSEMATGARPFSGDSSAQVISAILRDTPPSVDELRRDLPHHLARIIKHCVAKDPDDRFQTARDIHNELRDLPEEWANERSSRTTVGPAGQAPARRSSDRRWTPARRWALSALLVVVAGGLGVAGYMYRPWSSSGRHSLPAAKAAATRIAILPLANLTGAEEEGYLASGVTRFLINQLSEIPEISVLGHSHVSSYDATPQGLERLVRDSGIEAYVEGYIQGPEDSFRVYLNLTNADDGAVLKAMDFAGTADEVFDLHDRVVDAIRQELAVIIPPASLARLDRAPTASKEALLHFLEGLALASSSEPSDSARAESLFRRAVREDPQFAYAHWGLSEALLRAFRTGLGPDLLRPAEEAVSRALELDPEFGRARTTLAAIYRESGRIEESISILQSLTAGDLPGSTLLEALAISYDEVGDLALSEQSLRRALAQRPEAEALISLAESYAQAGESDRALDFYRRAVAAEPEMWFNHNVLGSHYVNLGQYDLAESSLQRARQLAPEEQLPLKNLGRMHLLQFNLAEAIAVYELIPEPQVDALTASNLGTAYFYLGTPASLEKAEEFYRLAVRLRPRDFQLQANLGDLYVRQERPDDARTQYGKALSLVEEQLEMLPRRELLRLKQPVYQAKLGRCETAVRHADSLDRDMARSADALRSTAQAFALCGENERAINLLGEAIPLGYSFEIMAQEDEFAGLRQDRKFQALAHQ